MAEQGNEARAGTDHRADGRTACGRTGANSARSRCTLARGLSLASPSREAGRTAPPWVGGWAVMARSAAVAVFGEVPEELVLVGREEVVDAVGLAGEEQVVDLRRMRRGLHRREAGVRDRRRRQPVDLPRVVRAVRVEVRLADRLRRRDVEPVPKG